MKRVYWSIADNNNLPYFKAMATSFKAIHPNEELVLFGQNEVRQTGDPDIFYRATPYFTKILMDQGYDEVCKLDADQIITGNLDHIWEGEFDLAGVFNSNPKEDVINPIRLLDINPFYYLNCGFVVMRSKEFVDHWLTLCTSDHFRNYQYREQDLLNIMVFYGNYKVKFLDESNKFHGLVSKGFWNKIELRGEKLVLPKGEFPQEDKEIVCIHVAGGNNPTKMRLGPYFKPEVLKYMEGLTGGSLR